MILDELQKRAGVDEEMRKGLHEMSKAGYETIENGLMLYKHALNLAGNDFFRTHLDTINVLGERDDQRKIIQRYSIK